MPCYYSSLKSANPASFIGVVVVTVVPNEYNIHFQSTNVRHPPKCVLTYRNDGDDFIITGLSPAMEFCKGSVVFGEPLTALKFLEKRASLAEMVFGHFN
jgi:hypothetical protein